MKNRVYIVAYGQTVRLIRATNRLQALYFAMQGTVKVSSITKAEMEEHMLKGTRIEEMTSGKQGEIE